jgi:hypothetical protein
MLFRRPVSVLWPDATGHHKKRFSQDEAFSGYPAAAISIFIGHDLVRSPTQLLVNYGCTTRHAPCQENSEITVEYTQITGSLAFGCAGQCCRELTPSPHSSWPATRRLVHLIVPFEGQQLPRRDPMQNKLKHADEIFLQSHPAQAEHPQVSSPGAHALPIATPTERLMI